MNAALLLANRYPYEIRWTGYLQKILGSEFYIIEAGLNGRILCQHSALPSY